MQSTDMSLRDQLLAAGATGSGPSPYPPSTSAQAVPENPYHASDSASPHEQYDNSGAQAQYGMGNDSAGDDGLSPDARKGKRELSTSKRAAQNRAAQRAFRQRKEGYIKKLEEQVKDFQAMEGTVRGLQNENFQLREYILILQSRLLENKSELPPAPSHIQLPTGPHGVQHPGSNAGESSASAVEQQLRMEMQHEGSHDAMRHLQAAAAQASEARPDQQYAMGQRGEEPDAK